MKEGLAICMTPELKKGRLYALTDLGRRVTADAFLLLAQFWVLWGVFYSVGAAVSLAGSEA